MAEQQVRMVLKAHHVEARFLGNAVEVVRGSQTTVIPIPCIDRVSADDDGTIHLMFDVAAADRGDASRAFTFRSSSRPEAQAFVDLVGTAVAESRREEHTTTDAVQVQVRDEPSGRRAVLSQRARVVTKLVLVYTAMTLTDIAIIDQPSAFALLPPATVGTMVGIGVFWDAADLHDYWSSLLSRRALRRVGISVPAHISRLQKPNSGSTLLFPVYTFQTVDGTGVTAHDRSGREKAPDHREYTVRYDPNDPAHVAGPVGKLAVVFYGFLCAFAAAGLAVVPVMTVVAFGYALSH